MKIIVITIITTALEIQIQNYDNCCYNINFILFFDQKDFLCIKKIIHLKLNKKILL
jgi:hypothetical protein